MEKLTSAHVSTALTQRLREKLFVESQVSEIFLGETEIAAKFRI